MKRANVGYARALRVGQTDAERALWRQLRDRQLLGWKFRRQHEIGSYIADFVCTDAWLIVELDGGQHAERAQQDARRTEWLQHAGYRVLRFWNDDVLMKMNLVLEQIVAALDVTSPHPGPLPGGERGKRSQLCLSPSPLRGEGRGEGK
jgi:very-short-patch-repair endonuclease